MVVFFIIRKNYKHFLAISAAYTFVRERPLLKNPKTMKHTNFLILILVFCYLQGQASPNKAAFITYKHLTGLTYEASIITYTQISSSIDRTALNIKWGDGNTELITRTSQEVIEVDLKKNVYTQTHTYTNHGIYSISMQDSTRMPNILNINGGNSDGFPFYVAAQLTIPNVNAYNNSIQLLSHPILSAQVGERFSYTPTAYDVDGDILSYELVTPQVNHNTAVSAYQLITDVSPGSNNIYSFNSKTGTLTWDAPQQAGWYNLTLKISECRNGAIVGATLVDYLIRVDFSLNAAFYNELSATPNDTIAPNDSIQISLNYSNNQADSIHLMAYSECLINGNLATVSLDSVSTNYLRKTFQWIPTTLNARCAPYVITLRGTTFLNNEQFSVDRTYLYYVRDASTTYCDTVCNGSTPINLIRERPLIAVQAAPNPFNSQTTIQLLNDSDDAVYSFSLFNVWGQRVRYISSIFDREIILDRRALPVGVYIYKIENDSNGMATGKLIVVD
jgi:hypothetical protein